MNVKYEEYTIGSKYGSIILSVRDVQTDRYRRENSDMVPVPPYFGFKILFQDVPVNKSVYYGKIVAYSSANSWSIEDYDIEKGDGPTASSPNVKVNVNHGRAKSSSRVTGNTAASIMELLIPDVATFIHDNPEILSTAFHLYMDEEIRYYTEQLKRYEKNVKDSKKKVADAKKLRDETTGDSLLSSVQKPVIVEEVEDAKTTES